MNREELLGNINRGNVAAALYPHLKPVLEEVREIAIAKMKNLYREGKASEGNLLACAAELCTLDDIDNRFKAKIRTGARATEELNGPE